MKGKFFQGAAAMLCVLLVFACLPASTAHGAYDHMYGKTYTVNGKTVPLPSLPMEMPFENCWEFAQEAYTEIWGQRFSEFLDSEDDMLRGMEPEGRALTEENLRAFVGAARIGACMRLCRYDQLFEGDLEGHNQIIVQKDAEGFTVYEGNIGWNGCIMVSYYTWDTYLKLWDQYSYIKYIKWPGAPEFQTAYAQENCVYTGTCQMEGTANGGCKLYTLPWPDKAAQDSLGVEVRRGTVLALTGLLLDREDGIWYEIRDPQGKRQYVRGQDVTLTGTEDCARLALIGQGTALEGAALWPSPEQMGEPIAVLQAGKKLTVLGLVYGKTGDYLLEVLTGDGRVGYVDAEAAALTGGARYRISAVSLEKEGMQRSAGVADVLWPGAERVILALQFDADGVLWLETAAGTYFRVS